MINNTSDVNNFAQHIVLGAGLGVVASTYCNNLKNVFKQKFRPKLA